MLHDIHITTGFAFVISFLVVSLIGMTLAFIYKMREAKLAAKNLSQSPIDPDNPFTITPTRYRQSQQPAPTPTQVIHTDSGMGGFGTGMLTGAILGSSMGHNTTVIHDSYPIDSGYCASSDGFSASWD